MTIDSVTRNAASQITGAIRDAARSTGASFEYLLTTARIESNLNPAAQAATTTAKGLYQFIEQTWLATMKRAGPALGLGQYSQGIIQGPDGRYQVADPQLYSKIMQLRADPTASSMMAGALTRANAADLAAGIGRQPTEGELYMAHFLGPDGAARLITTAETQPRANAADLFPRAAAANRSIFYAGSGRARSAAEVYGRLASRYEGARSVAFTPDLRKSKIAPISMAAAPPILPGTASANLRPPSVPIAAVDTAGLTQAYAEANNRAPPAPEPRPFFQTMFTDPPRHGVSAAVNTLWAPARVLDLFTDPKPVSGKPSGGA